MRGRGIFIIPLLLLLPGCGRGLPQGREMENMALMRTMGIDAEGEERLVTVSSSRRARGIQGEEESPLVLSACRETVGAACAAMQSQSDSYVYYGHVDQLLLGEELARQGISGALEHFGRDRNLGLGAQAWLIRNGRAEQAVQAGREEGADRRLATLRADGEMGMAGMSRTVGEALTALLEDGSAWLPALEPEGESLLERGYGVCRADGLAGWLTGEEARGLELALGRPGGEIVQLAGAGVRIDTSRLRCRPVAENGALTALELELRLTAEITEGPEDLDREAVRRAAGELGERRLRAAVERLQEWNADCLSLARRAGAARPGLWGLIAREWEEAFPALRLEIRCTAGLQGGGL